MSAAHGGQVVLSPETAELLPRLGLADDSAIIGSKTSTAPTGSTSSDRPDLRVPSAQVAVSLGPARPRTPFLGRETDSPRLSRRLLDPDTRLLTLTGPGGTGKTRLAIEAATSRSASPTASPGSRSRPFATLCSSFRRSRGAGDSRTPGPVSRRRDRRCASRQAGRSSSSTTPSTSSRTLRATSQGCAHHVPRSDSSSPAANASS